MMTQLTKSKEQGAASNNDSIKEEQVAAYNLRNLHTLKAAVRLVKSMVNHHFIKAYETPTFLLQTVLFQTALKNVEKKGNMNIIDLKRIISGKMFTQMIFLHVEEEIQADLSQIEDSGDFLAKRESELAIEQKNAALQTKRCLN